MKIAIPTDNGIRINKSLAEATEMLISTLEFGKVVRQEIRLLPAGALRNGVTIDCISDCDTVILGETDDKKSQYLNAGHFNIITTNESIITNVLMHYISEVMVKESDTCCAP